MKKTDSMKEMILLKKIKAEDPIELPMDDSFFDNLHNKIMLSVEKTEIKPVSKWTKTWVFLEQKTIVPREKLKKSIKVGITLTTLAFGVSLINAAFDYSQQLQLVKADANKSTILHEAQKSPTEWSDLVVNYQDESDFYADILSQRGHETIVEIDKVMSQSL